MIVAISGKAGSGKDTVGMFLQALSMEDGEGSYWWANPILYAKAYEYMPNCKGGWQIYKFADKMKALVASLLGVSARRLEDRDFKESTLGLEWGKKLSTAMPLIEPPITTVRDLMRHIGTGLRDNLHKDIWINGLLVDYKDDYSWIITDMRFKNELARMNDMGAYTIRIDKPDLWTGNHVSETELDECGMDFMINNEGNLEDLLYKTRKVYEEINSLRDQSSGTNRRHTWELQLPTSED